LFDRTRLIVQVLAGDPEVPFTILFREYQVARAWIASASRPVSKDGQS